MTAKAILAEAEIEAQLGALRAEIRAKWGTVYKCCLALGLPRGTVYQVMGRRYAGDMAAQLARLRAALAGHGPDAGRQERVFAAIKAVACRRCGSRRGGRCGSCDDLFREQARAAVAEFFSS